MEAWGKLQKTLIKLAASFGGVAAVTVTALHVFPLNAATVGFVYFLLIFSIAISWGFNEALVASVTATVAFNYYFLPPIGTLTIADPQNWVALISFLATSLIASRLSSRAKQRTQDAIERRQDIERLYTFSRAILLINNPDSFPKQLIQKLAETFPVSAAVLYERRTGLTFRAGPSEFEGFDEQLRESAMHGASYSDPERRRVITAVRLGSQPIAALALQGAHMPDSVVQGIGNLVAIGLERAKSEDLLHQIEAAQRSEQLRTALIDAMAHEFKTPLTSIRAATTSLLSNPDQLVESRTELLTIADEEGERLTQLIDDAVDMARLDNGRIDLQLATNDIEGIVGEVVRSMRIYIEDRPLDIVSWEFLSPVAVDRRLIKLALKQLLNNALKYSPEGSPVAIRIQDVDGSISIEVTNGGKGIPDAEQTRVFERFFRGPSTKHMIPGSGLGLSIAHAIARAHQGDLTVSSRDGETTFRMTLPATSKEHV